MIELDSATVIIVAAVVETLPTTLRVVLLRVTEVWSVTSPVSDTLVLGRTKI